MLTNNTEDAVQLMFIKPCICPQEICSGLGLASGQRVLDVGCGLGGPAIFMAQNYELSIHGVDLNPYLIDRAIQNQMQLEQKLRKQVMSPLQQVGVSSECFRATTRLL